MNVTLSAETSSSFDTTIASSTPQSQVEYGVNGYARQCETCQAAAINNTLCTLGKCLACCGLTGCGCCEFGPSSTTIQEALPDLPDIAEIDIDILDGQLIVHEDLPHADGSADNPVVDVSMNLADQFGQMQLSENITKGASSASEICNYCGKVGPGMLRCSRCQSVSYCSRKCQKKSWKLHKKICVPAAASVSQTVSTIQDAIQQQRKDAGNVTAISQGRTVQRGKQTADDECPICYDRYTSHGCFSQDEDATGRTKMVLPCKHDVCHRCLNGWRQQNG